MHRKYLSVTDVQRELGLSACQVQQLIDSRRLSAFRILGQWRIEQEMLDQMINDLYEEEAAACGSGAGEPSQAGRGGSAGRTPRQDPACSQRRGTAPAPSGA